MFGKLSRPIIQKEKEISGPFKSGLRSGFFCVFFSDLINVFDVFLPQLLLYPNPTDPLNGEAATLLLRDKIKYEQSVRGNNQVKKQNL
jgi:hypothetical protein